VSSEKEPQGHSSLSIQTLVISSLAAVAAAIVVPMFWARGSLLATAITPIIVAIVSEALNRPAKVITSVTPKVTRRSATGAGCAASSPPASAPAGKGRSRSRRAARTRSASTRTSARGAASRGSWRSSPACWPP